MIVDDFPDEDGLKRLCSELLESLSRPYDVDGKEIVIGASLGVAVFPRDGKTAEELSKKADLALYRAKAEGRGGFRFYDEELEVGVRTRRAMESGLRKALHAGEFELHYQPLIDVRGNTLLGFEALLRWIRNEALVPPAEFIPLAEETGLINSIGEWVVSEACSEASKWPTSIGIAINLSPVQFRDRNLVPSIVGPWSDPASHHRAWNSRSPSRCCSERLTQISILLRS